ncbi:MAG: RNA polymerase sigma factor [Acidimicrobiia bacterium]
MRWTRQHSAFGIDSRFSSLFLSHYDEVLGYCVRRVDRSGAEDAAAEVFAIAWRRIDELDWETARPWLFGIARGVLSNSRRSDQRRRRLSQKITSLGEGQVEGPEVAVIRREQDQQVIDVLDGLRDADREILMLSSWEELSAPEIATVLGISVSASEQRLHRARRRFAAALERTPAQVSPRAANRGGQS